MELAVDNMKSNFHINLKGKHVGAGLVREMYRSDDKVIYAVGDSPSGKPPKPKKERICKDCGKPFYDKGKTRCIPCRDRHEMGRNWKE